MTASILSSFSSEYATDVNVPVARNAIQSVGRIALHLSARANVCVDKLLALLQLDVDYVTAETLVVMTSEYVHTHTHTHTHLWLLNSLFEK